MRDSTNDELRRRIVALEAALIEAEEATKAKAALLAIICHEILVPLNGVAGMVELLASTSLTNTQRRFVGAAQITGKHLIGIADQLLDLSALEADHLKLSSAAIDPRVLALQSIAVHGDLATSKCLSLSSVVDANVPPQIWVDSLRLGQVLTNLVGNAVKFTQQGGIQLRVSSPTDERTDPEGLIVVRFEVQDTAVRTNPGAIDRMFDMFAQGDVSVPRRFGSEGLSLYISSRLVQLMGGRLLLNSQPSDGSRFLFDIRIESAFEIVSSSTEAHAGLM